jgi:hypothetical protein
MRGRPSRGIGAQVFAVARADHLPRLRETVSGAHRKGQVGSPDAFTATALRMPHARRADAGTTLLSDRE